MNPIAIALVIGAGVVGLTMLARKQNATAEWVRRYWNHFVQLPAGFRLSGRKAQYLARVQRVDSDYDEDDAESLVYTISQEAVFFAPADAVVTHIHMSLLEGALGVFEVRLAHLDARESSSFFIETDHSNPGGPMVGIGQFVHAGDPVVTARGALVTFSVEPRPVATGEGPFVSALEWTVNNSIRDEVVG